MKEKLYREELLKYKFSGEYRFVDSPQITVSNITGQGETKFAQSYICDDLQEFLKLHEGRNITFYVNPKTNNIYWTQDYYYDKEDRQYVRCYID